MGFRQMLLFILIGLNLLSCSVSRIEKNIKNRETAKVDTVGKISADSITRNKPKPYKEVITSKAITDSGLFIVHNIDNRIYFELPDSLLEKDILVVSRIEKGAVDYKPYDVWGYAGDQIGERIVRFSKGPSNRVLLKTVSYSERSLDSTENGLFKSVHNSNFQPIFGVFDIKAYSADSSAFVIEMTSFLNSDNGLLYFEPRFRSWYLLGGFEKDKSYIENIQSFPINVELHAINSYQLFGAKGLQTPIVTYKLNTSFVLLPKEPMKPRLFDERVGYFYNFYTDYDIPQSVQYTLMINRWRLEPKAEDREKYLKGELVEPKKPIVYYIDPETPKKWVPYLIQGVEDWNIAFEKAGFKNAIHAFEAPTHDPNFSLFDARHNVIVYKASPVANASGPNIHDPRSGEILETHINWYHNVMQLMHDWYMTQAGVNDTNARKMIFDDFLMGQLIRFVACHEVGHTIGLQHNFGASATIPVDSLRNKKYIEENGFCPSIMDYARFNYVAQSEDGIDEKGLFPRIGVYDKWAIEWGYKWLPDLNTREDEKAFMNSWIIESIKNDKRLAYGPQPSLGVSDPRNQSEDLGDDAMKAGSYGIENLKKTMKQLRTWTKEPNEDFHSLIRMQFEIWNQYYRYLMHVTNNIGMQTQTARTQAENEAVIGFVSREKQKRAVNFLNNYLFTTPLWLNDREIFKSIGGPGSYFPAIIQSAILKSILYYGKYAAMQNHSDVEGLSSSYTFDELLSDLEKNILKEFVDQAPIDFYRRNLQKIFIEQLILVGIPVKSQADQIEFSADFTSICQKHLKKILSDINKVLPKYKNEETRIHLSFLIKRIKHCLNENPFLIDSVQKNSTAISSDQSGIVNQKNILVNCWSDNQWNNWEEVLHVIKSFFPDMQY